MKFQEVKKYLESEGFSDWQRKGHGRFITAARVQLNSHRVWLFCEINIVAGTIQLDGLHINYRRLKSQQLASWLELAKDMVRERHNIGAQIN